jgi:hypothetical protein
MDIIISPHPDDECIGVYSILTNIQKKLIIIYNSDITLERKQESKKLNSYTSNIIDQYFIDDIPKILLEKNNKFYFPDPVNEIHPDHRKWGYIGETLARVGYDVIFYTINMNVPYIHKIEFPMEKELLLNQVYPSQSDLWKFEKKYILFEGYCKWIF